MGTRLLLFTAFLLFTGNAFAQMGGARQQMTPEQQAALMQERIEALSSAVTLTDAEKTQVEAILKDTNDKTQALRNDSGQDRQAMMEKITAIREEQDKKMEELLGAERFKKYQEIFPQGTMGGGAGGQGRPPRE